MKTLTRLLILSAGTSLFALPALRAEDAAAPSNQPPAAEAPTTPPGSHFKEMREHRMQQLDEKLHLTAEQKTRIQQIWDNAEAQGKALRDEQAASNRERRVKRREVMQTTHQQVRAVLTPEQQKLFDQMPHRNHRHAPSAGDAEGR